MASSTNAGGHQGTGVGQHNRQWVHYNAPTAPGSRTSFTQFSYDTATLAITGATATSGHVSIDSQQYRLAVSYKCSQCQKVVATLPISLMGCSASSGRHNYQRRNDWGTPFTARHTLYYDKGGATTLVSMHAI